MTILYQVEDIWNKLLKQSSESLEKDMYDWCCQILYGRSSVLDDLVVSMFVDNFNEKKFLKAKFNFSTEKIEQVQDSDKFYSDFNIAKWAGIHIDVMEKLELPQSEIKEFYLNNLNSNHVRLLYTDFCIEKGDYTAAIDVLKEGKAFSKKQGYSGVCFQYSKKLKALYKKMGLKNEYLKELWLLEIDYATGNLDIYQELEQQYSHDQWMIKREEIFSKISESRYSGVDKLYLADKLYDRLLEFVINDENIYSLREYEKILKPMYPEQLLLEYKNIVEKMSKDTGNRKYYRKIVRILNHMITYPNGLEETTKVVQEMGKKYSKRPAMMDELKNVKL